MTSGRKRMDGQTDLRQPDLRQQTDSQQPQPLAQGLGLVVREGRLADVPAIVDLERSIREAAHWPKREYVAMVAPAEQGPVRRHLVLAERDGEVVGYAVGSVVGHGAAAIGELENIAVAEKARRSGAGRALCQALLRWWDASRIGVVELEVRVGNAPAIAMYASLGWKQTGRRARYYHDPVEDAVLMELRREP